MGLVSGCHGSRTTERPSGGLRGDGGRHRSWEDVTLPSRLGSADVVRMPSRQPRSRLWAKQGGATIVRMGTIAGLPQSVASAIESFVAAACAAFGEDLHSIVLFGSAATGQLRVSSDVNVMVVCRRLPAAAVDAVRPAAEAARLQVNLRPMWILTEELPLAAEAFAVKYDDIAQRHRVLHGPDPFADLRIPRPAVIAQLRQTLLNLVLRLRAQWVDHGRHETRLGVALTEAIGPLRVAAATLLALQSRPASSPKVALAELAGARFADALRDISTLREGGHLPVGAAPKALLAVMELAQDMRATVAAIEP